MELEEKRVFRTDLFKSPRSKEWWYTGIYDKYHNAYFSFFFCRVPFIDKFNFTIFDLRKQRPFVFEKKLFLNNSQKNLMLDLKKSSEDLDINYLGDENNGWVFNFKSKDILVELSIKPTQPFFVKFDNNYINQYALLHFMQNNVQGKIITKTDTYEVTNALGYYDHCFGRIPRRTGWHWLAIQNKDISLVSLINYGTHPQKYTQVLISKTSSTSEWVRLNQDVSFEYLSKDKRTWRVTSCDIDLNIEVQMVSESREYIPPIIPFIVCLKHDEYFVKAIGRIKIDNKWLDIGELYGVLEEHYGKW